MSARLRAAPTLDGVLAVWAHDMPGTAACRGADGQTLTYRELQRSVAGLRAELAGHGVSPGDRVAVMAGRTRYGLSTLLAAWAHGASPVLLDERHPIDRSRRVVADSQCRLVITTEHSADLGCPVLDPTGTEQHDGEPAAWHRPEPGDEAYVVYTSGTTGWPKGVAVSHANLENFLVGASFLRYRPAGTAVVAVSPAFDGWLWSMLTPFVNGVQCATLDIAPHLPIEQQIIDLRAENLCMTPTLYGLIRHLPPVDVAVVAGERCPDSLITRLEAAAKRVINVYGPTETTIGATLADSFRGDDPRTIGRPLPGMLIEIVDEDLRPVAAGTEGEILIGGKGVSAGYIGAAEAGDRFIERDGVRWYRSGDVGVIQPDGQVRCLGRRDNQVKIGGFRIELEEVENIAAEVPGVAQATAYQHQATLALAVVASGGAAPERLTAQVGQAMAARLPQQVRPSRIDVVEAVPVDATGKVARAKLADSVAAAAHDVAEPAGALDRVLTLWADIFGTPVGPDADFYDLGGHSLLAARLAGNLEQTFGVRMSISDVLAHATPRGQLSRIQEMSRS